MRADQKEEKFHVTIPYHEPAYEIRAGERQFRSIVLIDAPDGKSAIEEALKQFHNLASQSSVSWKRVVQEKEITVEPVE